MEASLAHQAEAPSTPGSETSPAPVAAPAPSSGGSGAEQPAFHPAPQSQPLSPLEGLLAKLEATADSEERYRLAARINQMESLDLSPPAGSASKEALLAKMKATTDSEELFRIAAQINLLD